MFDHLLSAGESTYEPPAEHDWSEADAGPGTGLALATASYEEESGNTDWSYGVSQVHYRYRGMPRCMRMSTGRQNGSMRRTYTHLYGVHTENILRFLSKDISYTSPSYVNTLVCYEKPTLNARSIVSPRLRRLLIDTRYITNTISETGMEFQRYWAAC